MLEGLEVFEALARLGMLLEIAQRDLLVELAAELDVHHHPLGGIAAGFGIVVRVLGIKGGFYKTNKKANVSKCLSRYGKKDRLSNRQPSALSQFPSLQPLRGPCSWSDRRMHNLLASSPS